MKKVLYTAIFLLGCCITAQANPGDTTWVQANQVHLNYYNNFDTTVVFPDGSKTYRKILMIFTLGQYNCPANSQYCHQWDYTVQNYIMTKGGDTMEMNRFITPFATSGWPRFGSTWEQPYVFDVTDFASLLKDTATVRIHYSGYSGGFTADIKFAFIEGTPDRNVTGIAKLYDLSARYGDTTDPINSHFPTLSETAPAGTQSATLKFLVTGHGSDPNGCCEFANHSYDVKLNGTTIAQKDIWRDDCGMNELYAQGGTWIFNRGNWCPGALVRPIYHNLPGIIANTQYNIGIQFSPYTVDSNFGSYTSSAIIFYHAGFNKTLDASLDGIIAPTTNPEHYRENPSGSIPQVWIHNSGADSITSINITYGVKDSTMHTYTWNGSLAPLADTIITLPALSALTNMSLEGKTGIYQFVAQINSVNGTTDDDSTNNKMTSVFTVAPVWPGDLILTLKTSNITQQNGNFNLGNPNQKWVITDMNGNVIASRENTAADTKYTDTVAIPAIGFYKLTLTSDNGMGLHWWPFDGNSQVHQGSFTVQNLNDNLIPMKNYSYSGTPHDDWGSEYTQYFTVSEPGHAGINEVPWVNAVDIYPNPAEDFLNIAFYRKLNEPVTIKLVNVLGQVVYQTETQQQHFRINTQPFAGGIYTLLINNETGNLKTQKVVIRK